MNSENAKYETDKEDDEVKSLLRLPRDLRDRISALAKVNKRSINSEILYRLELSLAVPEDIVKACGDMPEIKDRLEFAVKLFQQSGARIILVDSEK